MNMIIKAMVSTALIISLIASCGLLVAMVSTTELRIAFVQTGHRPERLVNEFGTSVDMFERFLNVKIQTLYKPCDKEELPSVEELNEACDLLIIPGASIPIEKTTLKWVFDLQALVNNPKRRFWVFGVCFGHQLVGMAYGFRVKPMENGGEFGVYTIDTTDCISSITESLTVVESHRRTVVSPPGSSTSGKMELHVWARNENGIQGFVSRKHKIFTCQFHPDYTVEYLLASTTVKEFTDEEKRAMLSARIDNHLVAERLKKLVYA